MVLGCDQNRQLGVERTGQVDQGLDPGSSAGTLLQFADYIDRHAGPFGEQFLRQAALRPEPAELVADGVDAGHSCPPVRQVAVPAWP